MNTLLKIAIILALVPFIIYGIYLLGLTVFIAAMVL